MFKIDPHGDSHDKLWKRVHLRQIEDAPDHPKENERMVPVWFQFKLLDQDELDAMEQETEDMSEAERNKHWMRKVITNWDGLADLEGKPIPHSVEVSDVLAVKVRIVVALVNAYTMLLAEAKINKRQRGNSSR